tara:strand:- start:29 stop:1207 length:1179 start_codon:yes stop_codon:yes gene_type:complete
MVARETNLVNAFETTLAAQLASGGTTMNLTADPGVDSPAYFVIDPDNDSNREVVLWSSGTDHTGATVTRDIDSIHGTDPTHASGTTVRLAVVKQHIEEAHDAIQQGFILEDGDGTEINIAPILSAGVYTAREIKFIDSGGLDINWTDVSTGSDADPYDLTFTLDLNSLTAASVDIANDSVAIIDANDSNLTRKEALADVIAAIDGAGLTATSGVLSNDVIGKQSMWIPAGAMYPTTTAGCSIHTKVETTAGRPDIFVLDFDASADENAQFSVAMPSYWNEGTVTYQVYWTTTATDTDGVSWSVAGVAVSDNGTIDVAFGTAVVVDDDALSAAEDLCVTVESGALTIAGSPAAGDLCYFNIERDVSDTNDDMAEDARLVGIKIFYTIVDVHEA